jgi:GNAT superfamily N-acetyltransferase
MYDVHGQPATVRTLEAEVIPFDRSHAPDAAELVRVEIDRLRSAVPVLADSMTRPDIAERLDWLVERRSGLAAIRNGRLIGFLGWLTVDDFRGTGRRAAYCPAWAHAATDRDRERIYPLLYRAASREWTAAGCWAHAISLLAHDRDAVRTWCWNGFGVTVIDAIRAIGDLDRATVPDVTFRRAEPTDLDAIVELETEHWRHYTHPPMLMPARTPAAAEIRDVLQHPTASYWLAIAEDRPIGFLRFETATEGASDLVDSTTTIAISGAFVQPSLRGRGIATGILNTALLRYSTRGYDRCSVDFESFNPEAGSFWLRSFTPVCISMVRYPELVPDTAPAS